MKKLNEIINTCNVTAYGFPAFKGLAERSNPDGTPAVISTLSASVMADMGISKYYAPVIPRNTIYTTTDEVIAADLDANIVSIQPMDDITPTDQVVIVSRHAGTVDLLRGMYPNNTVLVDIKPDDICGKDVVGTLPPHLIQYAGRFKGFAIRDYNYAVDKDIDGDELRDRLVIASTIMVSIN